MLCKTGWRRSARGLYILPSSSRNSPRSCCCLMTVWVCVLPFKITIICLKFTSLLEFLIADLALASHSIVSLTLTSSPLLSAVIKAYAPSAIICHAFLVPHLLEHLYDEGHRHVEYSIIVVGEPTKGTMASVASNLRVLRFEDVEREGTKRVKVLSPIPSKFLLFSVGGMCLLNFE